MPYNAIDLFSGIGGLSEGMHQAEFDTLLAVEYDEKASQVYRLNHPDTIVLNRDIKIINEEELEQAIGDNEIHLLAGCPPCQGFSSIRRLNRSVPVADERNSLITEYVRFVEMVDPYCIMMENVPGLIDYDLFKEAINVLENELDYFIDFKVVNVKDYGIPQSRRRLVLLGSRLGPIQIAEPTFQRRTVRDVIGDLLPPRQSNDELHNVFPRHTESVQTRIELTPVNGGSRCDLPEEYQLACHKRENIGFNDVYGRLRWDEVSTTITGGCLNPSKGRFLHPEQHRNISAREAALIQTFPIDYQIPANIAKSRIALMIGNALPPLFSGIQSRHVSEHLENHGVMMP